MTLAYHHPGKQIDHRRRYDRRLSDKVLAAFDHACAVGEFEVANELLQTLESVFLRMEPGVTRKGSTTELLVQAYHQLWKARNGDLDGAKQVSAARGPLPL